ncbi:histidine kinase [Chitinophaga sp.]|uniref:sensor histidine kinase n=1 Tax=Chitinophaga sp. TaxID=1869181 RepID=UPI0031D530B7
MQQKIKQIFGISHPLIWFSALCIGILASIPKFLRLHIATWEMLIDVSVAGTYSLFVWYYNLYFLPRQHRYRFARSLVLGIGVMTVLVLIHQLIFPHYNMPSMMLMFQFRGLIINFTIYLFLFLLYQQYQNRQINMELLEAQFDLLKQQVNPHFIFNSLNTLKSMVDLQDKHASEFIVMLSEFYRASLDKKQAALIPLATELHTLHAYVFLLQARFEEGLQLDIDLPGEQLLIPPFTLQMLVENCIKHNIVSLEEPLHIRIYTTSQHIVVENNLQLKRSSGTSTHTGLNNINKRYQHLGKGNIDTICTASRFTVKLPLIYADSDR